MRVTYQYISDVVEKINANQAMVQACVIPSINELTKAVSAAKPRLAPPHRYPVIRLKQYVSVAIFLKREQGNQR